MGYEILGAEFNDFMTPLHPLDFSMETENINGINIISAKGEIYYKEHILHQQLSIQESQYRMEDDLKILGKGDSALLEIQLNLSDKEIFYQDKHKNDCIAPPKSGNIIFLSEEENQAKIMFEKNVTYKTFDIHLPLTFLDQYGGESSLLDQFLQKKENGISGALSPNSININAAIYQVIQAIKNCSFEGLTRKLYLESKTLEIIALLHEGMQNEPAKPIINEFDKERILWAASIIRKNLMNPFTIVALAQEVGINQTKLKSGFKAVFGNTIFGYLQEKRMDQAKKYLLDTQLSIQEIALLLGYQNTSNFSIAFKKIHGFAPSKMRDK